MVVLGNSNFGGRTGMILRSLVQGIAILAVGYGPSFASPPSFHILTTDASYSNEIFIVPVRISADGSTAVGNGTAGAFRWQNGVMTTLGAISGADSWMVSDVSGDGSVVVGLARISGGLATLKWSNETVTSLGDLTRGTDFDQGRLSISSDGATIVGTRRASDGWSYEGFLWRNGLTTGLGDLPGGRFQSKSYSISGNGSVVVGYSRSFADYPEAFRWEAGVMTELGDLQPYVTDSYAYGVSAHGSVVVGIGGINIQQPFRWANGVMSGLGFLPGTNVGIAFDVSADGSVVVGGCVPSLNGGFVWTVDRGMRHVKDMLVDDYGLDLMGMDLFLVTGISDDGKTLVGYGKRPESQFTESWIAHIPEPSAILLLGAAAPIPRRFLTFRAGHKRRE
jgi:probable HAF family extracellular repeat protein